MLILKSASPRRRQILENLKLRFQVEPSNINEDAKEAESPLSYLKRVTIAKLEPEKANLDSVYISSDTMVVLESRILSKPRDLKEGMEILSFLSGKVHSVFSGLAIYANGEIFYDFDETKVEFKSWGYGEFEKYLEDSKPYDKAGSYGIQDENGPVLRYEGSYSNVIGFPLRKFYQHYKIWKKYLG